VTSQASTLHLLTPTYKPVGGVVKIMDYATHALAAGYHVSISSPNRWDASLPLFNIERFRELRPDRPGVEIHSGRKLDIRQRDLVFVSLPTNFEAAYASLPRGMSPERIIHIIQNVRHVTPSWLGGYPLRLLTRPAARISTNDIVSNRIRPWLDERAYHEVIPLGHDLGYFHRDRTAGFSRPIRVAHTTWKSDIGDRVEAALADSGFTFRAIRESVTWRELRSLYRWADIFLCAPNPEEGFYMPGLEAMESGCVVLTPDAGGNMAYCRPGENCVLVGYDDVHGYVEALRQIRTWQPSEIDRIRYAGYGSTKPFDLAGERDAFIRYLKVLWKRIDEFESSYRMRT
jgi:Glycosyl transferases group 1